jgi:transcriptional regulator with XRE-family HTH domain
VVTSVISLSRSPRPSGVEQSAIARTYSDALLAFEVPTFGEIIYAVRHRRGQAQAVVAAAARVSAGYYSQLENCKRLAPPRKTALRIAQALRMNDLEASHLVSLAEGERASALLDAHLPPKVRLLLATIRSVAPQMPVELLDSIQSRLQEVNM